METETDEVRDFSELYPYDQMMAGIQALFDLQYQVSKVVTDVYSQIRPDIVRYLNLEELNPQSLEAIRRLLITLVNVSRFFNPRRFATFEQRNSSTRLTRTIQPMAEIIRLVAQINLMLGYITEQCDLVFSQIGPLMIRVSLAIPQYNESLWNDLLIYQTRVLAFLLDVLNPELFANLAE